MQITWLKRHPEEMYGCASLCYWDALFCAPYSIYTSEKVYLTTSSAVRMVRNVVIYRIDNFGYQFVRWSVAVHHHGLLFGKLDNVAVDMAENITKTGATTTMLVFLVGVGVLVVFHRYGSVGSSLCHR